MTDCKHCGKPIQRTNWYNGPGWMHEHSHKQFCDPKTIATPLVVTE